MRSNVKQLAAFMNDASYQMNAPVFKDKLLLPVTYLALDNCLSLIHIQLRQQNRNLLLSLTEYLSEVKATAETLNGTEIRFRDDASRDPNAL